MAIKTQHHVDNQSWRGPCQMLIFDYRYFSSMFKRSAPHLTSFCHQRDVQRIHIVRRSHLWKRPQLRKLLMGRATLALRISPSGRTQTRRVRCPGPHVGRPSVPRASPFFHVGCLILAAGSATCGVLRHHVGLLTTPRPPGHLCSMFAWSQTRCAQPERGEEGGERWRARSRCGGGRGERNKRPLLERTLSTAGLHHRSKTNSEATRCLEFVESQSARVAHEVRALFFFGGTHGLKLYVTTMAISNVCLMCETVFPNLTTARNHVLKAF